MTCPRSARRRRCASDLDVLTKFQKKTVRVLPTFDPEEQYDPYRPNDLGEYQEYRKRLKEERRAKYIESRRRKMNGEDSESSEYSDSEEEAPRRDGEVSILVELTGSTQDVCSTEDVFAPIFGFSIYALSPSCECIRRSDRRRGVCEALGSVTSCDWR